MVNYGDDGDVDNNGDDDDFQVTRSQEVMEGGEKKESQKPRCHSQQGIHRWKIQLIADVLLLKTHEPKKSTVPSGDQAPAV